MRFKAPFTFMIVVMMALTSAGCSDTSALESQIAELQDELASNNSTIAELNSKYSEEVEKLNTESEQYQTKIVDLENQVSALSEDITELNQQIEEKENIIAVRDNTIELLRKEDIAASNSWDISDISTKITEQNSVWWKYSWILKIQNDGSSGVTLDAYITWLDSDGFIVDDDRSYDLYAAPNQESTFTAYTLIDASVANSIQSINAKVSKS